MSKSDRCPPFLAGQGDPGRILHGLEAIPLRVLHLGCESVNPAHHRELFVNAFWRIYWVDRPGLRLISDGAEMPYPTDGVMIIPGWCPFTFLLTPGVGHAYIHFETPTLLRPVLRRVVPHPWSWRDEATLGAVRRLTSSLMSGVPAALLMQDATAIAQQVLAQQLRRLDATHHDLLQRRRGQARFAELRQWMDSRLQHSLSNAELARRAGLGIEPFIRAFTRDTGLSPAQYLIERRIARAAEALIASDDTIETIASRCGFANRHYFTRMFTRRVGQSPARYRYSR